MATETSLSSPRKIQIPIFVVDALFSRASLLKESHPEKRAGKQPFLPSLLPTSGLTGTRHGKKTKKKAKRCSSPEVTLQMLSEISSFRYPQAARTMLLSSPRDRVVQFGRAWAGVGADYVSSSKSVERALSD
jgi:hypothetical protein